MKLYDITPKQVRLELCTLCQLKCRDCYMRNSASNFCNVGGGYVSFDNFKRFVEANPFVKVIETSNSGEIFLNPDLDHIIQYAYEKNIRLQAYNGVNLNRLSDEMAESLVKHRFEGMTISLDGASQKVYSAYRRNGNFDNVINNIKKINKYKKMYNSPYPYLQWQYIIMDTNDSITEIRKAKEMAASLGMTIFFKKTWNADYKPRDIEGIKKETGIDYGC